MDTRKWSRFGLTLALSLMVSVVWAQSVSDGTITGTVTLPSGEAAPGVTVTLKSPALVTGERSVISDGDGRFVFLSLRPGTYELSANLSGFRGYSAPGIVLNSGDKRDINVAMQPGAFEESIIVSGAAPIIDTRTSTTDTTFSEELLSKLPTSRDAFYDIAVSAPGVASVGSDESWLRSPSAFGSAANENVFLVNGVNATNPRGAPWGSLVNVNYNTVEEVKILALGSKAEYGSFSGAAIDVLTKSGSNEFKGDVAYYSLVGDAADNTTLDFGSTEARFAPDGVFYADLDADLNDDLNTAPEDAWEASLTLGGPVLRDRIWFYGGFAKYDAATDTPLFEPLSLWESELWDLKLTGDFGPQHRAWLAYHAEDNWSGNTSWGATWDPDMVYNQGRDNTTLQAQYQWVLSDRDIVSGKYLGFDYEEHPIIPNNNGHPGYINWWKWTGGQSIGVGGDFPYIERQISDRQTIQADYTHYAAKFLGEHEVKFGVQYTGSEANWFGGYFHGYANFAYPYPYNYGPATSWWWNGPASWQWATDEDPVAPFYNKKYERNPWLTVRQAKTAGAFIDDTWTVNDRLTFDIGLRYDNMTAKYGEGAMFEAFDSPDEINNPVKTRTRAGSDNIFDFDTFSPRLGVAYALTEDRKTVIRGHVGRYYAPMGVETLRRFGPDMDPTMFTQTLHLLRMSQVDLNRNGMIDFDEVRPATRLLEGRTPERVMIPREARTGSWSLQVDPNLKSPYTDQYHVSLQRQIGADMSVEVGYIRKETKDLVAFQPFNEDTGEFWEWEAQPFTTWTGYQTQIWEVKLRDYNHDGKTDRDDAEFVTTNWGMRAVNTSSFAGKAAERTYDGLQLVFNKRYANRWQGLLAFNWNESDGFAPRTLDQNWYIDGPMIMDTPFGQTFNQFQNNLEGPLPMTPELMIKLAGSYTIPTIETDLGLRFRYDSGRAIFPIQSVPSWATWMTDLPDWAYLSGPCCQQLMVADDPKNADFTPSTKIVDLSVQKTFGIGGYGLNVSFDVLNAFNEAAANRFGVGEGDYGRVYSLIQPRTYRAGVKFNF